MIDSASLRIPCCIAVPEGYRRKAKYGVEMLLLPFRAIPEWTEREGLENGGIYYGTEPDEAPAAAWRIGALETTAAFFDGAASGPLSERQVTIAGEDVPVCFESFGDAPFDVVAASFYLLSGWQESAGRTRDEHGRFPFAASIHDRLNLVKIPVVDLYRALAEKELAKRGMALERKQFGSSTWAFCPTHDVDYLRKWRPGILYREVVERGIFNREKESFATRLKRMATAATGAVVPGDPYRRALSRMRDEVLARGGKSTYFFKTASRGPSDVRYAPESPFLQHLYLELRNAGFDIGLHPSYHAYNHGRYLREEKAALQRASGLTPTSVRTHYLRFDANVTPTLLAESGFEVDSSLGFAEKAGFRRSTCLPFPLYDLVHDLSLNLWEMPLVVMESTLFNREMLDLDGCVNATKQLMDTCRKHGGVFVGLWHNILWDEQDSPGWGAHFTECLDLAVGAGARMDSLSSALHSWK